MIFVLINIWVLASAPEKGSGMAFFAISTLIVPAFSLNPFWFDLGARLDILLTIYANYGLWVSWLTHPVFLRWMTGLLSTIWATICATICALPGFFAWVKHHITHPTQILARGDRDGELSCPPWSLAFWRPLMLQALFLFIDAVRFITRHVVKCIIWSCSRCYARCPGWRDIVKLLTTPYEPWRTEREARERRSQPVLQEREHDQERVGSNEAHAEVSRRQGEA